MGHRSGSRTTESHSRHSPKIVLPVKRKDRDRFIRDWLESLDSPTSLKAWLLYKYGEFHQLVNISVNPMDYESTYLFRRDYAASRFFSKCADLPTGIDTKAVAMTSAEEAERQCKHTNERWRQLSDGLVIDLDISLIVRVSQIVQKLLGTLKPEIFRDCGWSSGRSSSVFGPDVNPIGKYRGRPDCTLTAIPIAQRVMGSSPIWGQSALNADGPCTILSRGFVPTRGNTLITVPKNAKTDRTICYEPHCNIRLQLAVGSYLRSRLALNGILLNDQSVNQRRARLGSRTGHLATIDLSSASDTLALRVVFELLPLEWFELLDALRSKYTLWPDGSYRENQKFSSMGNGFTFELESLLFYSICSAVSNDVSVYGDDIILPSENYSSAQKALEMFGFRVNEKKSFSSGSFRESCGDDSFRGFPVTPVYLRSLPKTNEDIIKLHNQIRRWSSQFFPELKVCRMLRKWRMILPNLTGPSGYGDGHYHVDLDDAPNRASFWIDGWWFFTYTRLYRYELGNYLIEGVFPSRVGSAALCAALGPKRTTFTESAPLDRRRYRYKKIKVLANFCWPTVLWT